MSFFPIVVTSTHHFRCLCWTLSFSWWTQPWLLLSKTQAMSANSQEQSFSVSADSTFKFQAQIILLNQSAKGCLQEPALLRASETRSFPWYPNLGFSFLTFSLLILITFSSLFHLLVISFFLCFFFLYTFLAILPRGQLFLLSFFLSTTFRIYYLGIRKNQYLLKCTENSFVVYSKKRYQRNYISWCNGDWSHSGLEFRELAHHFGSITINYVTLGSWFHILCNSLFIVWRLMPYMIICFMILKICNATKVNLVKPTICSLTKTKHAESRKMIILTELSFSISHSSTWVRLKICLLLDLCV